MTHSDLLALLALVVSSVGVVFSLVAVWAGSLRRPSVSLKGMPLEAAVQLQAPDSSGSHARVPVLISNLGPRSTVVTAMEITRCLYAGPEPATMSIAPNLPPWIASGEDTARINAFFSTPFAVESNATVVRYLNVDLNHPEPRGRRTREEALVEFGERLRKPGQLMFEVSMTVAAPTLLGRRLVDRQLTELIFVPLERARADQVKSWRLDAARVGDAPYGKALRDAIAAATASPR